MEMQNGDESHEVTAMEHDESDMTEDEFDARWAAGRPVDVARQPTFRMTKPQIQSSDAGVFLEPTATTSSSGGSVAAPGVLTSR
jgi:hypothetical protein